MSEVISQAAPTLCMNVPMSELGWIPEGFGKSRYGEDAMDLAKSPHLVESLRSSFCDFTSLVVLQNSERDSCLTSFAASAKAEESIADFAIALLCAGGLWFCGSPMTSGPLDGVTRRCSVRGRRQPTSILQRGRIASLGPEVDFTKESFSGWNVASFAPPEIRLYDLTRAYRAASTRGRQTIRRMCFGEIHPSFSKTR